MNDLEISVAKDYDLLLSRAILVVTGAGLLSAGVVAALSGYRVAVLVMAIGAAAGLAFSLLYLVLVGISVAPTIRADTGRSAILHALKMAAQLAAMSALLVEIIAAVFIVV